MVKSCSTMYCEGNNHDKRAFGISTMGKILEGLFTDNGPSKKEVKKSVQRKKKRKILCYVLITCTEPDEDGIIEVDMSYDGKKWLAAYLVKSAQGILDGEKNGTI